MMGIWTSLTLMLQLLLMIIFLWMFGLPAIKRYQQKQVILMLLLLVVIILMVMLMVILMVMLMIVLTMARVDAIVLMPELQKRANGANILVLFFPGWC